MNTNVGLMPLEIYSDYVSDMIGQDWNWYYLFTGLNQEGYALNYYDHEGDIGDGMDINNEGQGFCFGYVSLDMVTFAENKASGNGLYHSDWTNNGVGCGLNQNCNSGDGDSSELTENDA